MAAIKLYRKSDWFRQSSIEPKTKSHAESYRSPARRDFARLIHSPSFRRLQGKTQLFPSHENDFFRNRLTHSLEVAQIAKSIAIRLNHLDPYLQDHPIDTDLVEFAALAHDMGHPPFGHNGEAALDELMLDNGGFEGNAQTLRLIARLEKKETQTFPSSDSLPEQLATDGEDIRLGLNLSFRAMGAILKYDNQIPFSKKIRRESGTEHDPVKGYYLSERPVVEAIKDNVLRRPAAEGWFKTLECSIMDVADDIAYSTYDIEDSFKAGFLSPIRMMAMPDDFKERVASGVREKIKTQYPQATPTEKDFQVSDVNRILGEMFREILEPSTAVAARAVAGITMAEASFLFGPPLDRQSREIQTNGYARTQFTAELVGRFIRDVNVSINDDEPAISRASLSLPVFKAVETLKRFSFQHLIESPRLKLAQSRGKQIIEKLFHTLVDNGTLLPDDWRYLYDRQGDGRGRERVVCDYIAGMTDRYCVEMYARLTGLDPMTIFKPH